jgi:polyisoprenoid-binding protein YceI
MTRTKWLLGGGLLSLVVLAAGVWFLFFKDDAPAAVSNAAANAQIDADLAALDAPVEGAGAGAASEGPEPPAEPAFDGTINGNWIVDDEIGEFDFRTASGSFAGFRVAEELTAVGETTAVGRSGEISGVVTIEDGTLTGAEITVDMTAIISDRPQRESAIRRAINATTFPTATFVFADAVDVSALEVGGAALAFTVEGALTVAGVTRDVTFEIEANVRADGFGIITGSTAVLWQDFGITPPSAPVVVSVADDGIIEFQLVVEQGPGSQDS